MESPSVEVLPITEVAANRNPDEPHLIRPKIPKTSTIGDINNTNNNVSEDDNIANPPENMEMMESAATGTGTISDNTARKPLSALSIFLLMAPLCLSVLLSSLDLTVTTPAIPAMVSSLSASSSSSSSSSTYGYIWIGTAFILSSTSMTPVWGTVSDIWGRKPVVLVALTIFLGGSLLCALAQDMSSMIAGRAVQGLGASGMGTMVNVIICDAFSLRDRGLYLAITSVVWAIGGSVGPVLGGWLTGSGESG